MSKKGPIILVDDDGDDQEIMIRVLEELKVPNKLLIFNDCGAALLYLRKTDEQPFLIICDINIPGQNGIEFKTEIDEDPQLRDKSVPFIFFSTSASQPVVDIAYKKLTVQGFFKKPENFPEVKRLINRVVEYWSDCKHPNSF
ncbi:MAG: response regulator [Chitinophagaceae bacterium]|nr:response regulator [Chitinophagaceae bacterium]